MIHFGVVEDNKDPKQLGRVKVRVFGIHTENKEDIPTESLPWASVQQPTTSAANSGVGQNSRLLQGSLVTLVFLDPHQQIPLVMGSVPSELKDYVLDINGTQVARDPVNQGFQDPDGVYPAERFIGENDTNRLAKDQTFTNSESYKRRTAGWNNFGAGWQTANPMKVSTVAEDKSDSWYQDVFWNEPEIAGGVEAEYPNNQVRMSANGIVEEWDDSHGGARIHVYHPSGTYEEILNDGTRTIKITGSDNQIFLSGQNMVIDGDWNITCTGDKRELINGNYILEVEGNMSQEVKGWMQEKIGENYEAEIVGNKSTNVVINEFHRVGKDQVTNIIEDEVRTVGATQNISVTGDVTHLYGEDVAISITATLDYIVGEAAKYTYKDNLINGVTGDFTETVKGNVDVTYTGTADWSVTGAVDWGVNSTYNVTSSGFATITAPKVVING